MVSPLPTGVFTRGTDWKGHVGPVATTLCSEIRALADSTPVVVDIITRLGRPAKVIWFELINSGPVVQVAFNTSSPATPVVDGTYAQITYTELKRIDSSVFLVAPINTAGDYLAIEKLYVKVESGGPADIDVWVW